VKSVIYGYTVLQYKQSFNYLTLHGTDFSNLKGCIFYTIEKPTKWTIFHIITFKIINPENTEDSAKKT
jgi:hypothetical protein